MKTILEYIYQNILETFFNLPKLKMQIHVSFALIPLAWNNLLD